MLAYRTWVRTDIIWALCNALLVSHMRPQPQIALRWVEVINQLPI